MHRPAQRLSPSTLGELPHSIRRPTYERRTLTEGVVHLGVGAFHRCHQAEYLDDILAGGHDSLGMVGVNLKPPGLAPMLGEQGGLYSRTLRTGTDRDTRVIGSILRVIDANDGPGLAAAVSALADPGVTTVTMTITEKGYCHIPSTGAVDAAHIGLAADVAAMTAHVRRRQAIAPRTAPGLLLMALHRRRDAALSSRRPRPINLVSCDNIPSNGAILSAVIAEVAAEVDPSLALWIADNAAFPSTMVDRIVPATTSADLDEAAKTLGLSDLAAVGGEPFRQWVIEDSFTARRPRWEAAGAEFVADVQPHEYVKMRVLNAAQTILALTGALAGHTYTFEAVADPILRDFAFRTLREETLPHLPRVAGMDARHYLDQSFARIANTAIRHRCHQVATDTSQKIRQRLLDPLRGNRSTGRVSPGLERAVAAWIAWLARSAPPFGARWPMDDPAAPRLSRVLGRRGRDVSGIVKDVLAHKDIFGPDLGQDDDLSGRVAGFVAEFLSGPSAAAQQSRTATAD